MTQALYSLGGGITFWSTILEVDMTFQISLGQPVFV